MNKMLYQNSKNGYGTCTCSEFQYFGYEDKLHQVYKLTISYQYIYNCTTRKYNNYACENNYHTENENKRPIYLRI